MITAAINYEHLLYEINIRNYTHSCDMSKITKLYDISFHTQSYNFFFFFVVVAVQRQFNPNSYDTHDRCN